MRKKIYVGNLPDSMEEADLRELFETKGEVNSITVMCDADSGKSRGFAFVEMASDKDAAKAIEDLNAYSTDGHGLIVREVQPKVERRKGDSTGGRNRQDSNQKSNW